MQKVSNKNLFIIFTILFSIFYLWDIGNLSAPRQGTESLYVQISQEMYDTNNIMTPHYRGERHWSKPPFHFWMPFPLYALMGESSLTGARASQAILTIILAVFTAGWLKRRFRIEPLLTLAFFLGGYGAIKFGRTFMMETSLSLLPFISSLFLFDYIKDKSKKSFILAILFGGAGALIKGPVTIVMSFLAMSCYQLFLYKKDKKFIIKECFFYFLAITILSCSWYFASYLSYKEEFFNYFFVRENLGKFGKVPMPMYKVFQGLFLYTLPWVLILPLTWNKLKESFKGLNKETYYFFFHFVCFFVVWLIPSQRSHHYAIPAVPFFMTFLLLQVDLDTLREKSKYVLALVTPLNLLFLVISCILVYFSNGVMIAVNLIFLLLIVISMIAIAKKNVLIGFNTIGLYLIFLWSIVISQFYIPAVPEGAKSLFKDKKVALVDRRSYFYEQSLEMNVEPIKKHQVQDFLNKENAVVIAAISRITPEIRDSHRVIAKWNKWVRRARWRHIKAALTQRSYEPLKEDVYLLMK
ncbi:dolichyl-phosphate-mannose-protein mannosyltransferase [Halobacteriovorax sp. BALOs_7]|uniref:ArnT family glycosyltransferase n=1 Tax=unclassified Halobacteriovorax TaxID=2639665 RepID=UPI000EA28656|nr:glycosyltransferase family 39 protein [Halobacteriovorax sp. BALOs_7]AYF45694.1 dolichyl-phosphate-mannose-protein mannosyltransferase [Halobacteriovorax sp. BALOs_7]